MASALVLVVAPLGVLAGTGWDGAPASAAPRTGSVVEPEHPEALAVGRGGVLYVADGQRDEILERRADARFTVYAGDGRAGFSGDGGPAVDADIDRPGGMAVSADGTVYFADAGNGRIRAVSPSGVIRTVAGNGGTGNVADGTPALDATLNPQAVAIGPDGLLYVASDPQVLRLDSDGTFTCVAGCNQQYEGIYGVGGPAVDGSADGPDGLAFNAAGDLFIAGFNTKAILMVDPAGTLHLVGSAYPRGSGGLVTAPDGSVLAMDELDVLGVSATGVRTVFAFAGDVYRSKRTFHGIRGFSPNGIAVGRDGSIYVDTYYGNGYTDESAIAVIAPDHRSSSLLWHGPRGV